MGYYSQLDWESSVDAYVDIKKAKKLEEILTRDGFVGFMDAKIEYREKDGKAEFMGIGLDEYYCKFYDDDCFAKLFSNVLISGWVRLIFKGEDGTVWGWQVEPKKVRPIEVIYRPGKAENIDFDLDTVKVQTDNLEAEIIAEGFKCKI